MTPPKVYNGSEPYIFVSYSHKDNETVWRLIEELNKKGFRIWYDDGIAVGTEFDDIISKKILGCSALLSYNTDNLFASSYCKTELLYATRKKKNIVNIVCTKDMPDWYEMRFATIYQQINVEKYPDERTLAAALAEAELLRECLDTVGGFSVTDDDAPVRETTGDASDTADTSDAADETGSSNVYSGSEPYVFFGYNRNDAEKAGQLIELLQKRGFRVWHEDVTSTGTEYAEIVAGKIGDCEVFLSYNTENTFSSQYCHRQLKYADMMKKPIINIMVTTQTPEWFETRFSSAYQKLTAADYPDDESLADALADIEQLRSCIDASAVVEETTSSDGNGDSSEKADREGSAKGYSGSEPYIFFSYSRSDAEKAERMIGCLTGKGFRVWYDDSADTGTEYADAAADKIAGCEVFLSYNTDSLFDNDGCTQKLKFADLMKKKIINIMAAGQIPEWFGTRFSPAYRQIDANGYPDEERIADALADDEALKTCRGTAAKTSSSSRKTSSSSRKTSSSSHPESAAVSTKTIKYDNGDKYEGEMKDGKKHGHGVYYHADGARYEGEYVDGKCNGHGVYYYAGGERYDGEFKDGKRHGHGVYYFTSGEKYDGEFADGKYNGHGVYYHADGARYEGEYVDGKCNGHGVYYYAGGDRYDGEFKDGKKHGHGVYYHADGARYEGEYVDGKCNGHGVYYYANGDRYDGEFKDGKRHGHGVYYHADGARYEGEYVDGKCNGHGVYYYAGGDRYDGEFKDGKRHGHGVYYFTNGEKYDGEFADEKYNGHGILYYANGDRYDGEWKDDKKHGHGVYYHADGRVIEGEWRDNKFID